MVGLGQDKNLMEQNKILKSIKKINKLHSLNHQKPKSRKFWHWRFQKIKTCITKIDYIKFRERKL